MKINILPFSKVITDSTKNFTKVKKQDYLESGKYSIIDQGKDFICGYTNEEKFVNFDDIPVIIFGDHTKVLKYIDFPIAIGADGVKVLTVDSQIADTRYIYYYLKSLKLHDAGYSRHFKYLKVKKIVLPEDKDDQIKIANLLTKVERLISKREESITLLDELLKSTFLDMFGDPILNPKGWDKKTCIDEARCIVPGRDKPKSFSGGIPWITTTNLIDKSHVIIDKNNYIGLSDGEIQQVKAKIIPKESIIFTCVGDLGIVSIVDEDIIMNQQLHSFQCFDTVNNIFMMFNISFQKNYMYKNASKTTVPYMNKATCNKIPLILPPKPLQDKFATIVQQLEATKAHYQKSLDELHQLFGSLSQRAFKGELGEIGTILVEKDV